MGKYSSDSDSEKRGSKSSYKSRSRRRSSSSESSCSKSRHKRDKQKSARRRSNSGSRYSRSRRSKSRSISRHKSHRTKTSKRSRTPEKHRSKRSQSRDRSARSRSKSYIREYTSKPRKRSSESCSSGSSVSLKSERISKVVKSSGNGDLKQKNKISLSSSLDTKVLDEINSDSFSPKQFASSKSKKLPDNIVIDLKKQTIKVPEVEPVEPDGIFHHNLFLNEEARMEKWVKELFSYRQKALQQGLKSSH